jgi:hypothetical protein
MKRRGTIMVRAQYARNKKTGRRNMRTKTDADLDGLVKYLKNAGHENHKGVRILPGKPWRTTFDAFIPTVVSAASIYQDFAADKAGARWNRDIAEHLIAAPDEGSDLSDAEIERMATRILEQISPRSPAVWAAHFDEESKTWEIHFALSSFTDDLIPALRVTDLRRRENTDYVLLVDEAGYVALQEANQVRVLNGRAPIRSLADIHSAKVASVVDVLSRHEDLSSKTDPSISELLGRFQGSPWRVLKHSKTSVSLASEEFSTPLHVQWKVLRDATAQRIKEKKLLLKRKMDHKTKDEGPGHSFL